MSEIRVNNIIDEAGTGAPTFPNGATIAGNLVATATTATTATSLSGTPNITVGTITGTDATLSGNLTVNGTTTTIDTAVTAVDSLAVDGSITALGNCGIGTVTPTPSDVAYNGASLHVHNPGGSGNGSQVHLTNGTTGNAAADGAHISMWSDNGLYITNQESAGFINFSSGGNSDRLKISQHGMVKFGAPLAEKCHYDTGGGLTGDYNHDLITYGNVYWSDTAAAGAFTFNLRGSATVALNDMMSTGESLSFWLAHACNSNTAYYMTAFKVDGTTISGTDILWSGGSAPTAAGGGTGTKDVYAFTVFKTANATFRAFASVTNHG